VSRVTLVVGLLLLGAGVLPTIATAAGIGARATGTTTVSTGTWGATASTTTLTFSTNTDQVVVVTNTGSIPLTARTYDVTISKPKGKAPTFTVFRCAVAWVSTRCSGGAGTEIGGPLNANTTTSITSTAPLAPGASMYLQVEPSGVKSATTVQMVPQVTAPSQLRAPVRTDQ